MGGATATSPMTPRQARSRPSVTAHRSRRRRVTSVIRVWKRATSYLPNTPGGNQMSDRRSFIRTAAMTTAAARLGMFGAEADAREARELAAIGRAAEWLNSPRLTPSSLAGKVVLVDFWTYTCINWIRTLPYRRAWAQKYRQGLVVIG